MRFRFEFRWIFLIAAALLLFSGPARAVVNEAAAHPASAGYSAAILFNRANGAARAGRTGPAILDYERALLLAPGDPDIAANLHFVRTKAGLPATPETWLARQLSLVAPDTLAWLGCAGLVLAGGSLFLLRLPAGRRGILRLTLLLGTLLVAADATEAVLLWPKLHEAVVLAGDTPALISPADNAESAFKLPAGATVTVRSELNPFALVQTADGRTGWVARRALGRVVPPADRPD